MCARLSKPQPRLEPLNELLFVAYMHDVLHITRTKRINAKHDKQLFVFLNVVFSDFPHSTMVLERGSFDEWVAYAMREGMDNARSMRRALKRLGIQNTNDIAHFSIVSRHLGWSTLRKRKRKEQTALGDCGICLEGKLVRVTTCKHHFCDECIRAWNKPTCPVCRRAVL
jgi:hypothetical protein